MYHVTVREGPGFCYPPHPPSIANPDNRDCSCEQNPEEAREEEGRRGCCGLGRAAEGVSSKGVAAARPSCLASP